jgi:hypothetical protein
MSFFAAFFLLLFLTGVRFFGDDDEDDFSGDLLSDSAAFPHLTLLRHRRHYQKKKHSA